ncbi:MAG TPA: hypothetical protein PK890_09560, partial [Terrimesophilobacter sp.]|nr:hypothetical protein [Terrimesophilobacter sp.]
IIVSDSASWDDLGDSVGVWGSVLVAFTAVAIGVYLLLRWLDGRAEPQPAAESEREGAPAQPEQYPPIG